MSERRSTPGGARRASERPGRRAAASPRRARVAPERPAGERPARRAAERRAPGPAPTPPSAPASASGSTPVLTSAQMIDGFDAFYRESRDRVLVQTLALTGDLTSSRVAVREAFIVAWHHWRKAAALPDPEAYVRPIAWRKAVRRSTTHPLRRRRGVEDEHRRVLDALATLTVAQRKALILTQLAAVTLDEMAHEIALPREAAERELQLGAAHFALELDIPTSSIPLALHGLGHVAEEVTWPRVTILRRQGGSRRRRHTVLGTAAALAALVAGGAASVEPDGDRPTLARERVAAPAPQAASPEDGGDSLPQASLLSAATVGEALRSKGWQQGETTDNSTGNGLVLPCQGERYADARGVAAWARDFTAGEGADQRSLVQFAEASARPARAERAFQRTVGWFASCSGPAATPASGEGSTPPRIQLVSTADVAGVGQQAALLVLRSQNAPRTHVVGIARTGVFTVTVALSTPTPAAKIKRESVARLLTSAVRSVCSLPGGSSCPTEEPTVTDRGAYPVGQVPWMLNEVDLPPLSSDQGPWVGTPTADLTEQRADAGAIGCDTASLFKEYRGQAIRTNQFRSFVLSTATDLPPEVGLTQTVGALPEDAAKAFVSRLRDQMAACPDRDTSAGTEVAELAREGKGPDALSAWHLTTALPGDRSVEYDVAVVRRGTSVSLLIYVTAPKARIDEQDFVALARRAQDRLANLQG